MCRCWWGQGVNLIMQLHWLCLKRWNVLWTVAVLITHVYFILYLSLQLIKSLWFKLLLQCCQGVETIWNFIVDVNCQHCCNSSVFWNIGIKDNSTSKIIYHNTFVLFLQPENYTLIFCFLLFWAFYTFYGTHQQLIPAYCIFCSTIATGIYLLYNILGFLLPTSEVNWIFPSGGGWSQFSWFRRKFIQCSSQVETLDTRH